ncbi:MAG: phospho-N-acetylmuramoyl-pentapeptide-transferase [Roseburia sp.]|nr:phospho-N-acetylmuramoyl-pentapeptide-transferase [Roseburia sp.]
MNHASILSVAVSFALSALLGPIVIPLLRKIKCGQTVREDGPASHLKKTGTPTMGGILILTAAVTTSLFFVEEYPRILPVLFLVFGFGTIGFLDDYIKVVCKSPEGLKPWQKFGGQIVVTGIFACYLLYFTDVTLAMRVPFWQGRYIDLGVWNVPVLFFIVLGTVNGVNFTDGLDGLAGSVTVIVATFFTVVAIGTGSGLEPLTCAVVGALMGFLLFNVHPASVFMGDTGSLALGGFVAGSAYMMNLPLFVALVGMVYLVEVISVILQVVYFKLSGGKRLFRMAPLHHHFELCGWSETQIVTVFTVFTALMCLLGLKGLG